MSGPATSPGDGRRHGAAVLLEPILALLGGCSPHGLIELERVLTHRLRERVSPAQERVTLLFPLAELLRSALAQDLPYHPIAKRQIERLVYDDLRPEGAPTSETLVRRFGGTDQGGWLWAQRAANGLLADGRKRGEGASWPCPQRGGRQEPDLTPKEVADGIRACALALGRRPSSSTYVEWMRLKRRQIKLGTQGRQSLPRLAHWETIRRCFGSWGAALAAASVTDAELAAARAARAPFVDARAREGTRSSTRKA